MKFSDSNGCDLSFQRSDAASSVTTPHQETDNNRKCAARSLSLMARAKQWTDEEVFLLLDLIKENKIVGIVKDSLASHYLANEFADRGCARSRSRVVALPTDKLRLFRNKGCFVS